MIETSLLTFSGRTGRDEGIGRDRAAGSADWSSTTRVLPAQSTTFLPLGVAVNRRPRCRTGRSASAPPRRPPPRAAPPACLGLCRLLAPPGWRRSRRFRRRLGTLGRRLRRLRPRKIGRPARHHARHRKLEISTRHMLEWFPHYCDWKMARPRFVPAGRDSRESPIWEGRALSGDQQPTSSTRAARWLGPLRIGPLQQVLGARNCANARRRRSPPSRH